MAADGNHATVELLMRHDPAEPHSTPIHNKLLTLLGEYLPLGGEANPNRFKVIYLDIGLDPAEWILKPEAAIVNRGALAEAYLSARKYLRTLPLKNGFHSFTGIAKLMPAMQ
ncbi:MAG: hypothetical protein GQ559_03070, partial [Desulfobulbaceae bacterium]|nr:hypothetical protein [Desulfobulbaceae bacterium]